MRKGQIGRPDETAGPDRVFCPRIRDRHADRPIGRQRVQLRPVLMRRDIGRGERQPVPADIDRSAQRHGPIGAPLRLLVRVARVGQGGIGAKRVRRPVAAQQHRGPGGGDPASPLPAATQHIVVIADRGFQAGKQAHRPLPQPQRVVVGPEAGQDGDAGLGAVARHAFGKQRIEHPRPCLRDGQHGHQGREPGRAHVPGPGPVLGRVCLPVLSCDGPHEVGASQGSLANPLTSGRESQGGRRTDAPLFVPAYLSSQTSSNRQPL